MIYINRCRRDENRKLIRPSKEWFKKARAATERAIEEGNTHEWDDNIYADRKEVRPALEELFHGKCAYCERELPGEWDVDHFRPKGRVAKQEDHPGYYWLGYEWENLYPSCKLCNQRRRDKPIWGDLRELPAQGKGYQFPLYDELTRAMSHDYDIHQEHTLLINPCYDNPEWYLGYDPKGQIYAVDVRNNPYGDASIEVFNLKRRWLCKRRKRIITRVINIMRIIRKWEDDENCEAVSDFKGILQELISDESEYAGAARFVAKNVEMF